MTTQIKIEKKTLSSSLKKELDKFQTKSAQIRYLSSLGYKYGEISSVLSEYHDKLVRFQHVYNVLHTIQKKK